MQLGLPGNCIERVIRAVEITPLPNAPEIVMGMIDVHGRVVPVINLRRRLGLSAREGSVEDHLILGSAGTRTVALLVDSVSSVRECFQADTVPARDILPYLPYIEGIAKLKDGMLIIHDLAAFLSLDEERELDRALRDRFDKG